MLDVKFEWINDYPFVFVYNRNMLLNRQLYELVISKEQEILAINHEKLMEECGGQYRPYFGESTTAKADFYNIYTWRHPALMTLWQAVKLAYNTMLEQLNIPRRYKYIQSWVNITRTGNKTASKLDRHTHWPSELCFFGYYAINAEGSITTYGFSPEPDAATDIPFCNKNGQLTFSVCRWKGRQNYHQVSEWNREEPRVTIACDIVDSAWWNKDQFLLPFD